MRLGVAVLLQAGVAIEMVVAQVEPHRDPRTEGRRRGELKAAHLHDVHAAIGGLLHLRAHRHADVAAHEDVAPGRVGSLDSSVGEAGLALGVSVTQRLRIGGSIATTQTPPNGELNPPRR